MFEVQTDAVVDYIDKDQIRRDIEATRRAGADLIAVAVHWGTEYVLQPVASQRKLADWLVNEGVDHGYRRTSACGGTDGAAHEQHHGPKAGGGLFLRQLYFKHEDTRHAWRRIC